MVVMIMMLQCGCDGAMIFNATQPLRIKTTSLLQSTNVVMTTLNDMAPISQRNDRR